MFLTLNEVRLALGLAPTLSDMPLTGVSTDTRTIAPGVLFVALRGENFDGHDYVEAAFQKGAVAAVVDREIPGVVGEFVVVADPLIAYGKIAETWRLRFSIPVIAITGSIGKTTVKEMIALALGSLGPVLKSEKNENNEVGVPQTLLRLNESHRAVVIEMGMRGFGQIKYLAQVTRPTIGIVTKIGESHIELLGSREAIADAKGELLESLGAGNTAVLNADDDFFERLRVKTSAALRTYGQSVGANVEVVQALRHGSGLSVELMVDGEALLATLHSPAIHDSVNAAGAVAAAVAAGVRPRDAVAGIESYRPSNMRMEILSGRDGQIVISDCYNAAPSSVKSALNTLAGIENRGVKAAFLGDMRELGDFADQMHREIAEVACRLGIENIYAVGEHMPAAFPNARASFADSEAAAQYVRDGLSLSSEDVVLVKGSRALHMEKVVEALVQR